MGETLSPIRALLGERGVLKNYPKKPKEEPALVFSTVQPSTDFLNKRLPWEF